MGRRELLLQLRSVPPFPPFPSYIPVPPNILTFPPDAGGNFLNYVVRIEPTGQDNTNAAWCTGIINNIRGERGRVIGYESCNGEKCLCTKCMRDTR
jgi:hypothetical protein